MSNEEFELPENLFKVYHTPDDNVLHVINQTQDFSISRIQLYDLLGKTLLNTTANLNKSEIGIKLPKLSKGVYIVKILDDARGHITKKMVIE